MRFRFPTRWLPGRRGWWLLVTLLVVIGGLAIGSRWLPEVKQLAASTLGNWMRRGSPSGDAAHDHGEDAHDEPGQGDERARP